MLLYYLYIFNIVMHIVLIYVKFFSEFLIKNQLFVNIIDNCGRYSSSSSI